MEQLLQSGACFQLILHYTESNDVLCVFSCENLFPCLCHSCVANCIFNKRYLFNLGILGLSAALLTLRTEIDAYLVETTKFNNVLLRSGTVAMTNGNFFLSLL